MSDLIKKDIKYLNKDFGRFRKNLINFAKMYFPNTYNDFNESSPGMMFIEMASYVGDVLSFYTDTQLRESLPSEAQERFNLYTLAQNFGYKPKTVTPSNVQLDVYQLIPSTYNTGVTVDANLASPDWRYALTIQPDMRVTTQAGTTFRTLDYVDFATSSSVNNTDVSVYETDSTGKIQYYLLKKQVSAKSGEIKSAAFTFGDPKVYDKIVLSDTNVTEIVSIIDDDGNTWYEVDYLAQDTIMKPIRNIPYNDPELSEYSGTVPYLLCLKQVPHRFTTHLREDNLTEIQFGSGLSSESDEDIIPNPKNVGMGLQYLARNVDLSIDPTNFIYTRTYGVAPNNVTLTVTYAIGKGRVENVQPNSINTISSITFDEDINSLDATLLTSIKDSVAANNTVPAKGANSQDDIEKIRRDAVADFASQNRAVTKEDYVIRCYAMPAKFGSVVKAYITTDEQLSGKATGTVTKKSTDWMTKGKEGEKDISHKPEIVVGAYGGGRRRRAVTIGSTQQIQPAYIQQQMIDNISNAMDQYYFIQNYQGPGGTGGYADPSGNIGNATKILNHLALNLYVLTYDANKNFVALNTALNNNLENYLSQHRMLTDAINIKTPFIVNLGIEFEIIPTSAANNSDVLLRCISYLKSAFDNDKMSINQPLIITKYMSGLDKLEGVQTVSSFKFVNKYDTTSGYAGNVYTCNNATRNNILYPPVDPSIFEIKFPNKDIKGKIVSY
jgi:hypothetical protein